MRIPRFFSPVALSPSTTVELTGQVANHIGRVLRMTVGDSLVLFDGRGGEYPAKIEHIGKHAVSVRTAEYHPFEVESPLQIELGIAISKGDRMDHVVQKSTELGVTSITPLISERTEVRLKGDRLAKKVAHWQQVAISACEQCGRNRVPALANPEAFADWAGRCGADQKLVLHHRAPHKAMATDTPSSIALLVGPEGGLSSGEIQYAQDQGFSGLAIGPRVLRTETAPLVALTILQSRWGDFSQQS